MSTLRPSTEGTTVAACAQVVDGRVVGDAAATVHGATLDSRSIEPQDLYAALPGAHTHGGVFAAAAVGQGAAAILTDAVGLELIEAAGVEVPVIVVDSPRAVLGAVSAQIYQTRDLSMRLIGITGTNGKTTTGYLIASALEALGRTLGLIGTVETRIGDERIRSVRTTPESCDLHRLLAVMTQRGIGECVMEVSSHALALHRVDGVVFDIALFTNLSQDHLDFHLDMEDYFRAKAALFTPERSRLGIVCIDDDWGRRLAARASVPVVTVGHEGSGADYVISRVGDADFALAGPDRVVLDLRSALPGDFNITNTAMAAVTLLRLGFGADEVAAAVLTDPHVPGRMERIVLDHPDAPLAVVDYAHSPDAVAAAVAALRPTTAGPLVVVLGAGGGRDSSKRPGMGAAAAAADVVIVTDDNPRAEDPATIRAAVVSGARGSGTTAVVEEIAGRAAAIERAVEIACAAGESATVAVVGKGHETGQEIQGVVHPFDDRTVLEQALRQRLGVPS